MDPKIIQKKEEYKQKLHKLNESLWVAGLRDPISRIQQMSFLFFLKMLEEQDDAMTKEAELTKRDYKSIYRGKNEGYRWSSWIHKSGEDLYKFVRDKVFPFIAEVRNGHENIRKIFHDARLRIDDPPTLKNAIELIDGIEFSELDADVKGDLYEELLNQIESAGELGQFLTPRHVIRFIVEMVNPKIGQTVYDPACGSGGFLIAVYEWIKLQNSAKENIEKVNEHFRGPGDKLTSRQWKFLQNETFWGNDVDPEMVRLTLMNLFLHGLEESDIKRRDTIAGNEEEEETINFDYILTNPPFAGKINKERTRRSLPIASSKTQILFLGHVIDSLKKGGRGGIILPEGVLFGTQRDDKEIRRYLMERCDLQAVISMPSGVFQPYAGVKASVLIFEKGKPSKEVWFYDMKGDGSSLSAAHKFGPQFINDIPDLLKKWPQREKSQQSWFTSVKEITENDFILSANAYNPLSDEEEVTHRDPKVILNEIKVGEEKIKKSLQDISKQI